MACNHGVAAKCKQCAGDHAHVWGLYDMGRSRWVCSVSGCGAARCGFLYKVDGDWVPCVLRDGHYEPHDFGHVWVAV